jgi:hypothetical protein
MHFHQKDFVPPWDDSIGRVGLANDLTGRKIIYND